ncbi:hypothetical protein [Mesorhizobium sp. M0802]|uniref:hypothetical protein n=1 Tax=Mesorhizobium sp. M0802 TaxID=2957001 RepID=UPI00333DC51A
MTRYILGEEPQPEYPTAAPPKWGVEKPSNAQLAAMTDWIQQQDYEPHDAPESNLTAASRDDLHRYLASMPRISREEYRAVLRGAKRQEAGKLHAWDDLVACLRAEQPSRHFLGVVADLIAANALHNRGPRQRKEGTITPAEARRRHERFVGILRRSYPDKRTGIYQSRAMDLMAFEVQRADETFAAARKRVKNAKARQPDTTAWAIERAVQRLSEAIIF